MAIPDIPNYHALAVLLLTLLAFFLFTREKILLETSSLFVLVVLIIGFELFPFSSHFGTVGPVDFFHGFGHEALVAMCALMVAGYALERTGALEPVARQLGRFWKRAPSLALLATLVVCAALSAFMNNTPIVVLMLPMLVGAAVRSKASTAGILLPMNFATLIGGMGTPIGTSTNLLVVAVAADMGMQRFQMFDFVMPVVISGGLAILYLWLVAPRLTPERQPPMLEVSRRVFNAQLTIPRHSTLAGRPLSNLLARAGGGLRVRRILRENGHNVTPFPDARVRSGDRLLVADTVPHLQDFSAVLGVELQMESGTHDRPSAGDRQLAEVVVTLGSSLHGMKLGEVRLKENHGLEILALHSASGEHPIEMSGLGEVNLQASDVLLVQGKSDDIARLKSSGDLLVLDSTTDLPHTRKAPLALLIMVAIVALAASGILPIATSSVLGVAVLIGTGCLTWRDTTNALNAQVIFVIVASLALGSALMSTGAADWLARVFLAVSFGAPAWVVLSGLMLLMVILTNFVANNVPAVVGTPIAISIASELGLPLEPFVLAVLFGANLSFVTPMAYKTNLLVMNAGGYKFGDFVRVGTPLAILMWLSLSIILSVSYKL